MSSTRQNAVQPRVVRSREITYADTGTTVPAVDVPAGWVVPPYGVTVVVETALSGGTPAIDVGDGDNDDGWIDNTDVTEGTAGAYSGTEANTGAYAQAGKHYSSVDTIDVTLSASLTAGVLYLLVQMFPLESE